MQPIDATILRTVLYADVFHFPLTPDELYRYLIADEAIPIATLRERIQHSKVLNTLLIQDDGYICLKSRRALIQLRQQREAATRDMWQAAVRYGQWLSHIPFVRMVALTGALAVRNPASAEDDFDYLLVTTPGRVWLARAFAILIVRFARVFGRELCPNYVLAEDNLKQSRQDVYTAHEVAQMYPVYGMAVYDRMLRENEWMRDFLPNAEAHHNSVDRPRWMRDALERVLGGWLGDRLEQWEFQRKLRKFSGQLSEDDSQAEISASSVKGHFEDHGQPVLAAYEQRLRQYGLIEHHLHAVAGD